MSADSGPDDWSSSQGWNPYTYVKNNPLAHTDPHGMCSECHGSGGAESTGGGSGSWLGNFFSNLFGSGSNANTLSTYTITSQYYDPNTGAPMQTVIVEASPWPSLPSLANLRNGIDNPSASVLVWPGMNQAGLTISEPIVPPPPIVCPNGLPPSVQSNPNLYANVRDGTLFGVDTFAIGGAGLYVANAIGAPEFEIGELAIFAGYGAMYGVAPGVVLGGLVTPTSCRP